MERIALLDGNLIETREMFHDSLKRQLGFPEYYGNNLDALWDLLTECSDKCEIEIRNLDRLYEKMGAYAGLAIATLKEAEDANPCICVMIVNEESIEELDE